LSSAVICLLRWDLCTPFTEKDGVQRKCICYAFVHCIAASLVILRAC
jgi:hypothetical protein